MTAPNPLPRPCPSATGQDSDRGRRSRIHVGRVARSRRLKGWRPRPPSKAAETSQKDIPDDPDGAYRVSAVPHDGPCWRSEDSGTVR